MKLIMVDLDGTLIDTKEVNYYSYREALNAFGYELDYDFYCKNCNGKHYMDFLPQIATYDTDILKKIHHIKKRAYVKYLNYARLNEALLELILQCKESYKIAMVTTASRMNTYDILEKFHIKEYFDLILTHEDISRSKPDPEGFFKAMDYFNAKPGECIIFEDSDVGIAAANKTGAFVFAVKGFN